MYSISLGETEYDDIKASYLGNVNEQVIVFSNIKFKLKKIIDRRSVQ